LARLTGEAGGVIFELLHEAFGTFIGLVYEVLLV
jgi:hypothetical protein